MLLMSIDLGLGFFGLTDDRRSRKVNRTFVVDLSTSTIKNIIENRKGKGGLYIVKTLNNFKNFCEKISYVRKSIINTCNFFGRSQTAT